jgi:hypothetical protein
MKRPFRNQPGGGELPSANPTRANRFGCSAKGAQDA